MLNERIKELRRVLNLNQIEFADKIAAHHSSISEWENNKVEIKDSSLLLIELVFNVNSEWLRAGKGEMFKPSLIPNAEKLVAWLKSLPEDDQIWAVKEFERHVPEFKKWHGK